MKPFNALAGRKKLAGLFVAAALGGCQGAGNIDAFSPTPGGALATMTYHPEITQVCADVSPARIVYQTGSGLNTVYYLATVNESDYETNTNVLLRAQGVRAQMSFRQRGWGLAPRLTGGISKTESLSPSLNNQQIEYWAQDVADQANRDVVNRNLAGRCLTNFISGLYRDPS